MNLLSMALDAAQKVFPETVRVVIRVMRFGSGTYGVVFEIGEMSVLHALTTAELEAARPGVIEAALEDSVRVLADAWRAGCGDVEKG